jgi:NADH-quinone oxidoreductase subunit G
MPRKLLIDDEEIEVEDGLTILQACELAGREIPRFCYHDRLSIAGNCRMCLVQVDGMPKPVASCAMGVNDLRPTRDGTPNRIDTKTPIVKKAREGVMEFLLINHPLDCPICDQGGECDLQDQAMAYGGGGSRYDENKRAVDEKHLGPLIKTQMTRCIQCTRCVRFMTEIAGIEELGAAGRGEDMEITTYLEEGMMSELSANVVDLCPVGALTHRPIAHNARPWELRKTDSIDVMDAVGSAISVQSRGREVMRILPRTNEAVNEEWISDKTRHVADGLRTQRLDQPYVRKDGRLQPASWAEALDAVAARLQAASASRIGALAGDLAGCEEIFALKDLMTRLGVENLDCRVDGEALTGEHGRAGYVFNSTIAGLDEADAILLIGANPRTDAAVLSARMNLRWRNTDLKIAVIGPADETPYDYEHIGTGAKDLARLIDGSHPFAKTLRDSKRPMIIVGSAATARPDGGAVYAAAARIARDAASGTDDGWHTFNVLHTAAGRVGAMDLGFLPPSGTDFSQDGLAVLFLLGCDSDRITNTNAEFVVYLGTHGDKGAHRADVILPGAAYTEKSATYVNTEGRAQVTAKAAFAPGDAREDWKIIRALSDKVGHTLAYDDLAGLRAAMYASVPYLAQIGHIAPADQAGIGAVKPAPEAQTAALTDAPFAPALADFYLSNPIARASAVMAELSALRQATAKRAEAAE